MPQPVNAIAIQEYRVRSGPSLQAPTVGLVHVDQPLLIVGETRGFYRVKNAQGAKGWVAQDGIAPLEPRAMIESLRAAPSPCAPDLSSCPPSGCEEPKSNHALFNRIKRTFPADASARSLTIPKFVALQRSVNETFGEVIHDLDRADREALRQMGEGRLVRFTGYLVGKPHSSTGESVNCSLHGTPNNDIHLTLATAPDLTEYEGIVAEVIPQGRPESWNSQKPSTIAEQGHLVMVYGQLFLDNAHFPNGDPAHPRAGQPKRISTWEVHPITKFFVCPTNQCTSTSKAGWVPLSDWGE